PQGNGRASIWRKTLLGLAIIPFGIGLSPSWLQPATAQIATPDSGGTPAITPSITPGAVPSIPGGAAPAGGVPFSTPAKKADVIKTIKVVGVEKIDPRTILAYLPFNVGDKWSDDLGGQAIQRLNSTSLFGLVTISQSDGIVTVKVFENPVIDQIAFEGNKEIEDKDLLMVLGNNSNVKPRSIYSRVGIKKAVNILQQVYLQRGYFQANVSPKLIQIENNRIQLVFEIKEGPVPKIEAIEFYGNSSFSDDNLRTIVSSSVYSPLKFFSTTNAFDPERIRNDKAQLLRFYQDNGYADAAILGATAQLNKTKDGITLTYSIREGQKYYLDNVKITSGIKQLPINKLNGQLAVAKGDVYSISAVEKSERAITKSLRDDYDYNFMMATTRTVTNPDKKTIDLTIDVAQGPRTFINRIVIKGNGRTLDSVIRRKITIVEGDPIDQEKVQRSLQNIQNTGYFSAVQPNLVPVSGRPDRVDLIINVQEKSTGALNFSAGYSTKDGIILGVVFGENNLLGSARVLSFNGNFAIPITSTQGSNFNQSYSIAYTEPFLADKDLAMTTTLYRTSTQNTAGQYSQTRTGASVGFRFNYNDNFSQYFYYNFYFNKVLATSNAVATSLGGDYFSSIFGQQISFDNRDNPANPASGFYLTFANDLSGLGGNTYYLRTSATAAGYFKIP
ncbi:MAG: outer membrane protein assembly factor BamA, partial [Alphaproteobacteria bacterium]|nr:outer membrane protein assembly factor BamA [Alphaproteobacteria bacterium]